MGLPTFHGPVILPYTGQLLYFHIFYQIMNEYDQTVDANILIGHCDLVS